MSSILDKKLSILERLPSSQRMREHDEAGKRTKKSKKKKHYENTSIRIGTKTCGSRLVRIVYLGVWIIHIHNLSIILGR